MQGTGSTQHPSTPTTTDLSDLPTIPHVLVALLDGCQQTATDYGKLAAIVRHDPVLYARIVATAAARETLSTDQFERLDRLMAGLGLDTLRTIAITSAVNYFFSPPEAAIKKALGRYLQQARHTAVLSSLIAEACGYPRHQEAWFAGLTHNIGQLLLLVRHTGEYAETYLSAASDTELAEFEQEWFGRSSIDKGADFLQSVSVESFLADAVLYQLEDAESLQDAPQLIRILSLARKLHRQPSMSSADPEVRSICDQLQLSDTDVEQILKDTGKQLEALNLHFNIAGGDGDPSNLSDQAAVRHLRNRIQGFATAWGLSQQQSTSVGSESGWQRILSNFSILFGPHRALAFEYNESAGTLRGLISSEGEDARLRQLSLHVIRGRSLPAEAVLSGRPLNSQNHDGNPLSLPDKQLLRLLRSESFLCIPLQHRGYRFGVMVVGMNSRQQRAIRHQQAQLDQFMLATGTDMARLQETSLLCQQSLESQRNQHQAAVSKLAHEANNPLGIIKNYTQILERSLADNDRVSEQFGIIREEIDRVATIIQQMKTTNTAVDVADGLVNINQLIGDQVSMFRESVFKPGQIDCLLDLDNGLTTVRSHALSLRQVLTNLLKNAAEAMPDGGRITVRSRNNVNFNGKIYVELTVADTGSGITPDVFEKAFVPLKTTKGEEHSGLGLSIVSSLISNLNGYISCRNSEGGGAEFCVLLPLNQ